MHVFQKRKHLTDLDMVYPKVNYGLSLLNLGPASLAVSCVKQGRQQEGSHRIHIFLFSSCWLLCMCRSYVCTLCQPLGPWPTYVGASCQPLGLWADLLQVLHANLCGFMPTSGPLGRLCVTLADAGGFTCVVIAVGRYGVVPYCATVREDVHTHQPMW